MLRRCYPSWLDNSAFLGSFERRWAWSGNYAIQLAGGLLGKVQRQLLVVDAFQSRRSLLVWKVFGARLDGWTNADHPTESTPGVVPELYVKENCVYGALSPRGPTIRLLAKVFPINNTIVS